jgi:hypothetical protein
MLERSKWNGMEHIETICLIPFQGPPSYVSKNKEAFSRRILSSGERTWQGEVININHFSLF